MIFRLAALVSFLAFAAGQVRDDRDAQEVSARLMQQTNGYVATVPSTTSGFVGVIGRSTLGGDQVQGGIAEGLTTQWTFRYNIDEGVRPGQEITAVNVHCQDGGVSPTEAAPLIRSINVDNLENNGLLGGGAEVIGAEPELVNFLISGDNCYLNFTTADNPQGELRTNLVCALSTIDSGSPTCAGSASTLMASSALALSIVASVATLW
jgi:hypothetical protein